MQQVIKEGGEENKSNLYELHIVFYSNMLHISLCESKQKIQIF